MCKNNPVWTFELTATPYQITVDIFIINLIKFCVSVRLSVNRVDCDETE